MIGDALALAVDDARLLARIGGPYGEAARTAARELASASTASRAARLASVRAPVPTGLRGVHRSWIEHALAALPPRARSVLAEGPRDAVDVWLARYACAELPGLPPTHDGAVRTLADLVALDGDALHAWLLRVGRAQLAYAASLTRTTAPRRDELGSARAVIARCRGGDPLAIAARTASPHLMRAPLASRQLAVRLPRELGMMFEREVAAHAGDHPPESASWQALL
jgi:hypothetical protein